jgi:hypothetical protein
VVDATIDLNEFDGLFLISGPGCGLLGIELLGPLVLTQLWMRRCQRRRECAR